MEWDINKIESIQPGDTTVSSQTQSSPRQVTLDTNVDPSHSLLLFQIGTTASGLDQLSIAGRITNGNTLEFYRHSDSTIRNIHYYVIDFGSECGNKQDGTVGRELVYPLEILVVDTYTNPVSNVPISFVRSGGNGVLLTPPQILSDEDGIAVARLQLGSATGAYQGSAKESRRGKDSNTQSKARSYE